MPKSTQLTTASGAAFVLGARCTGYTLRNEEAVDIRHREDRNVSLTTDADKGELLKAGESYARKFDKPSRRAITVHGIIASGTGYLTYEAFYE